jgi:hypothetical protein
LIGPPTLTDEPGSFGPEANMVEALRRTVGSEYYNR